jgi:hypothetical protein
LTAPAQPICRKQFFEGIAPARHGLGRMRFRELNVILACVPLLGCPDDVLDAGDGETSSTGDGDGDADPGDGDGDSGDADGDADPGDGDGDSGDGDGDADPGDGDGDSGDGDGDAGPGDGDGGPLPDATELQLSLSPVKHFDFDWMPALDADHYQLLESRGMGEPYVQVGGDVVDLSISLTVPLHLRGNASYKVAACNTNGCTESEPVSPTENLVGSIGYFKASNTEFGDGFGYSVALSADGTTLAVGATNEGSAATGIDGDQTDNSALGAGAVYLFSLDGQGEWYQQAYIKASDTTALDGFGWAVSLSGNGDTLAVTTRTHGGTGGAVYVFVRDGQDVWSQEANFAASNTEIDDFFGHSAALSSDGNTLAVSAVGEDSNATGINGNAADNSAAGAGATYVFVRDQGMWSQQAYIKASNTDVEDRFGDHIALSSDGDTLVVGASSEDSNATGVDGNSADNSALFSGAAYVFVRDNQGAWSQQAYVKASNAESGDRFGYGVALSGDGDVLAVGAYGEASGATGIDGDETDNSVSAAGAAYLFIRDDQGAWSHAAYVKPSYVDGDNFGFSIALSSDGNTLAVGAVSDHSEALGIGGDQTDDSMNIIGSVYVFARDGQGDWLEQAYVKSGNTALADIMFSLGGLALSADGSTLAVTAPEEDGTATGINGDPTDQSAWYSGAVYLY